MRTLRTRLMLLYAVPFFLSGAILLTIPILQTRESQPVGGPDPAPAGPSNVSPLVTTSAVGLAVMVLVAIGLGWLIAGRFLRPLRTVISTAKEISASNLHRRLGPTGRNDEFTELAETLNGLFARLEASFESQRHFVASASHELRTPLTAERTLLQVALADPQASVQTWRATAREVIKLGEAQERLIDSLLTLASSEQGIEQPEPIDLARIAANSLLSRQLLADRRGLRIDASLGPALAAGDPHLAESLMTNLVDNALRYNVADGIVEVSTSTLAGRASLVVANTGPVISPDDVGRLFEPFQRLGDQRVRHGAGYGLGLAIVRAIVTAHGATLIPQAQPGGGLRIEVAFPPVQESAGRS
jgi:signal transduction histidine kinase